MSACLSPLSVTLVYCGQTVGWIRMPLAMEVASAQATLCSMGTQLPQRGGHNSPPLFGPCLLWPNGWMDPDFIWYGGRPRPRRHCARWRPSSSAQGAHHNFQPMSAVTKRRDGSRCHLVLRYASMPRLRQHRVRWRPSAPPLPAPKKEEDTAAPTFRPMSVVAKRLDG